MKFKLKAWHVYLIGIPVVWLGTHAIMNDIDAASLSGEYFLWGAVGLAIYYVTRRLWFGKQTRTKPDNQ